MIIESSLISMEGQSKSLVTYTKDESLKMWTGKQRPNFEGQNTSANQSKPLEDIVEITKEGIEALKASQKPPVDEDYEDIELSDKDKQKLLMIKTLLEKLTGKKVRFYLPEKIKLRKLDAEKIGIVENRPVKQGWGLEYDFHEEYYEKQQMSFSSSGTVKTADGREISFDLDLKMSREFMSSQSISIRAGDAVLKDPLVVNYGAAAPAFTSDKMSFDIDCDGTADQISKLAQGSGFLSLDLNGDGRINDGSELFGAKSGDGFADLSRYDSDGNSWIDENDPVFNKLRIWSNEPDGTQRLLALGQVGIGAIYLGSISTAFEMKNNANDLQGKIQSTGIFLRENGTAGTIQHIDVAV